MTRKKFLIIFLAMLGLSFALFANGILGKFVYDDPLVLGRPDLYSVIDIPALFATPYHYKMPQSGLYRPITIASFALNFILFGDSPVSFHVVNIIIHAIVSFLVFFFIFRMTRQDIFALCAGFIFLVLPIHVEDVTSIVGRAELLAALFGLLFLICRKRLVLAMVFLVLALLSKETSVALLPIVFGIFMIIDRDSFRRALKKTLLFGLLLIPYVFLRFLVLGQYAFKPTIDFAYNPLIGASFWHTLWTACKVLALYLERIFIPFRLASDYSYNQIPVVVNPLFDPFALLGILILASRVVLIWSWRIERYTAVASVLFLMPFLVISNIFFKTGTIMAERLMYMPSIGVAMLVAYGFFILYQRGGRIRAVAIVGLSLVFACYTGVVLARNQVWLNQEDLSIDAYGKSPESIITQLGMAQVLVAHGNYEDAKRLLVGANQRYSKNVEILNLLGVISWTQKNHKDAVMYFDRVLELRPYYFDTLTNLTRLTYQQGNLQQTQYYLKIMLDHYGPEIGFQNVKLYLLVLNRLKYFDEVISLRPLTNQFDDDSIRFLVGYAYYMRKQFDQAVLLIGSTKASDVFTRFNDIVKQF